LFSFHSKAKGTLDFNALNISYWSRLSRMLYLLRKNQ